MSDGEHMEVEEVREYYRACSNGLYCVSCEIVLQLREEEEKKSTFLGGQAVTGSGSEKGEIKKIAITHELHTGTQNR